MCMDMLRELANSQLPLRVVDTSQIDLVRVLDAAGCIVALIPPAHVDPDDCERQDPATVLEITAHGQKKLSRESTGGFAMDTTHLPEEMPTQEQHHGPCPEGSALRRISTRSPKRHSA